MALTIGQFILMRTRNPDNPSDPYEPKRESFLELTRASFSPSQPTALPNPPKVDVSRPAQLPNPPKVSLSQPSELPPIPSVSLSQPSQLPLPPAVSLSQPMTLPAPPSVLKSQPAQLPPPPQVSLSQPDVLPAPPPVVLSQPSDLPPLLKIKNQEQNKIDYPEVDVKSKPSPLPDPPPFSPKDQGVIKVQDVFKKPEPKEVHEAMSAFEPDNGYKILKDLYSPMGNIESVSPGDPVAYERHLERLHRDPAKLLVHSAKQLALFSMNNNGKIWNPAMIAPPPMIGGLIKPAIDTTEYTREVAENKYDPETENMLVEEMKSVLRTNFNNSFDDNHEYSDRQYVTIRELFEESVSKSKPVLLQNKNNGSGLVKVFAKDQVSLGLMRKESEDGTTVNNRSTTKPLEKDPLTLGSYYDGIIPVKFKYDNEMGYQEYDDSSLDEDEGYMPLSFTDLRTVGTENKTLFFRATNVQVSEELSPSWNKSNYFGRVDPVVSYQSTQRSFSLQFDIVAFSPTDLDTIFKKLHWLSSMVYPMYDSFLQYKSGPVIKLRLGNLLLGRSKSGIIGKGLPGIIESLSFDYNEGLWELQENKKLPRQVKVSLNFLVLHDSVIGLDENGNFGGIFLDDKEKEVSSAAFRNFGDSVSNLDRLQDSRTDPSSNRKKELPPEQTIQQIQLESSQDKTKRKNTSQEKKVEKKKQGPRVEKVQSNADLRGYKNPFSSGVSVEALGDGTETFDRAMKKAKGGF